MSDAVNLQTGTATDSEGIPDGWMGLDSGLKSRELFKTTVLESKTILWNGYVISLTEVTFVLSKTTS